MGSIERIDFREKIAKNLITNGYNLQRLSAQRYNPAWLNLGISTSLTFGNLALAMASELNPQILRILVSSMPFEIVTLALIMADQKRRWIGRVPLSTHILPKFAEYTRGIGKMLLLKI